MEDDVRALEEFANKTKDKIEYIRGMALELRAKGKKGKDVADSLGVGRQAVYKWEKMYSTSGINGLKRKYSPGRPPKKKRDAKKIIPQLMKRDPMLFGFLKGR